MAWILTFFFACCTGVLAVFLIVEWEGRRRAIRTLSKATQRLDALQGTAEENDRLREERDSIAKTYLALRNQFSGVTSASGERDRILAEAQRYTEEFNARVAEAKQRFAERKAQMEEELKQEQERTTLESDLFRQRLAEQTAQMEEELKRERERTASDCEAFRRRTQEEMRQLESELESLRKDHQTLSDAAALRDMGFYEPRYSYTTSVAYQEALDKNLAEQESMVKAKTAAICSKAWRVEGSLSAGKRHSDKLLTLMLRAFNGECDSAISRVRYNNFSSMEARISRAFTAINKLGAPQACELTEAYRELKIAELRLSFEHAAKVQAEREEQQEIKEQMRQEALAARELERARQEAEKEEHRRRIELEKAREDLERASREAESQERQEALEAKLRQLEEQLAEAHDVAERTRSRAEMTKSGHVYVISNVGAFGENVYKIGMTRRLDPMDRIWELSDASVPFDFDVHAIIYTEDAPGLEGELHHLFNERRLNLVNERKEFFHVTMEEIASVVRSRCGDIELTLVAEAAEFRQSEAARRAKGLPPLNSRTASPALQEAS